VKGKEESGCGLNLQTCFTIKPANRQVLLGLNYQTREVAHPLRSQNPIRQAVINVSGSYDDVVGSD